MKKVYWTMPAFMLILLVIGVGAYRSARQPAQVGQKSVVRQLPQPDIPVSAVHGSYWRDEIVQAGDHLGLVLARMGINPQSIQAFEQESPIDIQQLQLHPEQIISARIDATTHDVSDIQFFNDDDNGELYLVVLERVNGHWQQHSDKSDTQTMLSLRSAVLTSSDTGILSQIMPYEVRVELKEMFADKLDWNTLQAGDHIRVLYESLYFRGQEVATGNILAAEIDTHGTTYYGYYVEQGESGGNFYDEQGKPLKQGTGGQPIESFTRISSPYGVRFHPILHTVRMHTGIDYAAPTGTKILASSDGVVSFRGWKGGYGNTVMITHKDGIESLYGHMSAFISQVNVGTQVQAGDVVGLVGSTGRSTGPHLHYEVRVNGQHVNPATVVLPAPKLSEQQLAQLKQSQQKWGQMMQAVRGLPVLVSQRNE